MISKFRDRDDTIEQIWRPRWSISKFRDRDDTIEQVLRPVMEFTIYIKEQNAQPVLNLVRGVILVSKFLRCIFRYVILLIVSCEVRFTVSYAKLKIIYFSNKKVYAKCIKNNSYQFACTSIFKNIIFLK